MTCHYPRGAHLSDKDPLVVSCSIVHFSVTTGRVEPHNNTLQLLPQLSSSHSPSLKESIISQGVLWGTASCYFCVAGHLDLIKKYDRLTEEFNFDLRQSCFASAILLLFQQGWNRSISVQWQSVTSGVDPFGLKTPLINLYIGQFQELLLLQWKLLSFLFLKQFRFESLW